jgi:copper chaperone CopZ
MKKIDILFFEGCPNHFPAVELAREVAQELDLDIEINELEVFGPEDAQDLSFLGSPSIHVDGLDIEPAARELTDFGFSCRTYSGEGLPPKEMLMAAIFEEVPFRSFVTQHVSLPRKEVFCAAESVPDDNMKPTGAWAASGAFVAATGATVAAIVASACCWLPIVLISVGASAGGVAVTFEKTRPLFLSVAGALLAVGFYSVYFKKEVCEPGSACESSNLKRKRANKFILWTATAGALVFAVFPSYVGALVKNPANTNAQVDVQTASTLHFAIDGMSCEGCSVAVSQALSNFEGIISASVDYKYATATAVFEKSIKLDTAAMIQAISDSGFRATVIPERNE